MILRPATAADAEDVWRWRNDPVTRAMSRTPDEVALDSHLRWFGRALANPDLTLLIGEDEGRKVGMVRFDRGTETEVSINVNPDCRGRGYGEQLLSAGVASVGGAVTAEIKAENAGSRRLFEKVGFRFVETRDGMRRYRFDPS